MDNRKELFSHLREKEFSVYLNGADATAYDSTSGTWTIYKPALSNVTDIAVESFHSDAYPLFSSNNISDLITLYWPSFVGTPTNSVHALSPGNFDKYQGNNLDDMLTQLATNIDNVSTSINGLHAKFVFGYVSTNDKAVITMSTPTNTSGANAYPIIVQNDGRSPLLELLGFSRTTQSSLSFTADNLTVQAALPHKLGWFWQRLFVNMPCLNIQDPYAQSNNFPFMANNILELLNDESQNHTLAAQNSVFNEFWTYQAQTNSLAWKKLPYALGYITDWKVQILTGQGIPVDVSWKQPNWSLKLRVKALML